MKRVNIIMSSYNGEKYIREQIESILNQSYKNIKLIVRDDGSKDGTVDILREYEAAGKIKLYVGKNVGFIKSFHWLICHAGEADYYAFADQDDVWLQNKIEIAVDRLEQDEFFINFGKGEETCSKPLLYFSNYNLCDEKLNVIRSAYREDYVRRTSFANCLVDCASLGFNSVFNRAAKEMMAENPPRCSDGHDWWTYMVCQGLGKVIYDPRITVMYRRCGNNESAGGMSFIKFQIWRIKKFFLNDNCKVIKGMHREYARLYRDKLSKEDRELLLLFARKKYNLIAAIKKATYKKRYREKLFDEISVRILLLFEKI